jgi:D-alanine-D-alanine ligase
VGILAGGKSAEHEVSLQSARHIFGAIDRDKYEPALIQIDKTGRWLTAQSVEQTLKHNFDVIFPVLHGPFGEDGTVQGLLKLLCLPFVGTDVLGSACGMDKDVSKRLLRDAGLPIGKFITVQAAEKPPLFSELAEKLSLPLFVKPANMGSSVGVYKINNETAYKESVRRAREYDHKIILEEYIEGREVECAVLEGAENEPPFASIPGEIIASHEFYSYEAKYLDEHGADLRIPAPFPLPVIQEIQALAVRTFSCLCAGGLSRIDFFMRKDGALFVNEINTMPGFTKISMYPKLMEASGIPLPRLIDRLIENAFARFAREQALKTNYL